MKRGVLLLLTTVSLLLGTYFYPVGGSIWTASEVTGLARVAGGQRLELQHSNMLESAVAEALAAARTDRFRRFFPGARCHPIALEFGTADGWVGVQLRCNGGLLFDTILREAWRPVSQ